MRRLLALCRDPGLRRFVLVGCFGFGVDAGIVLLAGRGAGLDPVTARVISLPLAIAATWMLNNLWAFRGHRRSWSGTAWRYVVVQGTSQFVNFLVFTGEMLWISIAADYLLVALAIASVAAMTVSYIGSRLWVFPQP